MTIERSISVRDNEVLDQVLLSMLTSPGNCSTCDGGGGSHLASKDLGENVRPFITTPALSFSFFFFFFFGSGEKFAHTNPTLNARISPQWFSELRRL